MNILSTLIAAQIISCVLAGAPFVYYKGNPPLDAKIVRQTQKWNVAEGKLAGYFYATEYSWHGTGDLGYIGPQPRPEGTTNHLAFSNFGWGSWSDHPNCGQGADFSIAGVTCKTDWPWEYGKNYTTEVVLIDHNSTDGSNKWGGYLLDPENDVNITIGEYWTPKNFTLLNTGGSTFDEWYLWQAPFPNHEKCIPYSKFIQYYPVQYTESGEENPLRLYYTDNFNVQGDPCAKAANASNQRFDGFDGGFVIQNGWLNKEYEGIV